MRSTTCRRRSRSAATMCACITRRGIHRAAYVSRFVSRRGGRQHAHADRRRHAVRRIDRTHRSTGWRLQHADQRDPHGAVRVSRRDARVSRTRRADDDRPRTPHESVSHLSAGETRRTTKGRGRSLRQLGVQLSRVTASSTRPMRRRSPALSSAPDALVVDERAVGALEILDLQLARLRPSAGSARARPSPRR